MEERPRYFEDALSNFVHDMASGGAIRHLVDMGYSIDRIMEQLDYPTPRRRVEKTVYQYMMESGILLDALPVEETVMKVSHLNNVSRPVISQRLRELIQKNDKDSSYMQCPFGRWLQENQTEYLDQLSCLTGREKEYISGVPWHGDIMYHRLNDRMLEIGIELAVHSSLELKFYFLTSRDIMIVNRMSHELDVYKN